MKTKRQKVGDGVWVATCILAMVLGYILCLVLRFTGVQP